MGIRRRIVIAGIVFTVLLAAAWLALTPRQPPEPSYQGRSLSQWMVAYQPRGFWSPGGSQRKEADAAIRYMGTNCLPFLLKMMEAQDSNLKLQLVKLAQRQSVIKFTFQPAETKRAIAVCAFQALGADARPAFPQLAAMFRQKAGQARLPEGMCIASMVSPGASPPPPGPPAVWMRDENAARNRTRKYSTNEIVAVLGKPDNTPVPDKIVYDLGINADRSFIGKWTLAFDIENGNVETYSITSTGIATMMPPPSRVKP